MTAPPPPLTALQRDALRMAGDSWIRKPIGIDERVVSRLVDLGLLDRKRDRPPRGIRVTATFVRRTARGRQALGLPPLEQTGDSQS